MSARVTWLLAVKDGMPYLPQTLASIAAQTRGDWEVLAWDNGSQDGTAQELRRWIPAILPGEAVLDRPFESLGACRAAMVERCRSELCACIDADDVSFPNRLEEQVAFLDAHPRVAVVGSHVHRLDAQGVDHGPFYPPPTSPEDIVHAMLCENPVAQPSVLFRRAAILDAGNYRDVGRVNVEDYDLWMRVAARYQVANMESVLLQYRVHDQSTTQLSLRHNRLDRAVDARFALCAPALFGCGHRTAKLLRARRHPFALVPLVRASKYLQRTQGGHWLRRMRSPSFIRAAQRLIARRDFLSGLAIAALSPDKKAVPRFLLQFARGFAPARR